MIERLLLLSGVKKETEEKKDSPPRSRSPHRFEKDALSVSESKQPQSTTPRDRSRTPRRIPAATEAEVEAGLGRGMTRMH